MVQSRFSANQSALLKSVTDEVMNDFFSSFYQSWISKYVEEQEGKLRKISGKELNERLNATAKMLNALSERDAQKQIEQDIENSIKEMKEKYSIYGHFDYRNLSNSPAEWKAVESMLKKAMEAQLINLKSGQILSALIENNAWLKQSLEVIEDEGALKNCAAYELLKQIHQDLLVSLMESEGNSLESKIKNLPDLLTNPKIKWRGVSKNWWEKDLLTYPFLKIQNIDKAAYEEASFSTYLIQTYLKWQKLPLANRPPPEFDFNYRPSTMDLFRLIMKTDSESLKALQCAPMQLNEFKNYSKNQFDQFKTLLINCRTEKEPLWIAVNKENGKWVAYIPDHLSAQEKANVEKQFPEVNLQIVSYENDPSLEDHAKWHAVLLSRIYPWCRNQDKNKPSLSEYRSTLPISLLAQQMRENIVIKTDNEELASDLVHLQKAFAYQPPFSDRQFSEQIHKSGGKFLLDNQPLFYEITLNEKMMIDLDNGSLRLDSKKIIVSEGSDALLMRAMLIAYLHPEYSHLELGAYQSTNEAEAKVINQLFDYDTSIKTITPKLKENQTLIGEASSFANPMYCAARNRFLDGNEPDYLSLSKNNIQARKNLWKSTGEAIATFFQKDKASTDLAELSPRFEAIAQMGKRGLDELFIHLENRYAKAWQGQYKEPAPNLSCTLDLAGSVFDKPHEYIQYLTQKIHAFDQSKNGCSPLFHSLSLILPSKLDSESLDAVMKLVSELNERKKQYPDEVADIHFHHLDIENSHQLLTRLQDLANHGLQVQISFPDWEGLKHTEQKTIYRELQNTISNNQRREPHFNLTNQTQDIYEYTEKKNLSAERMTDKSQAQPVQAVVNEMASDMTYPLMSNAVSFQHQAQQEQAQEQQAQQQMQQQMQMKQSSASYLGDKSKLITRDNIHEKYSSRWEKLSEINKIHSGLKADATLDKLFSQIVGSPKNADKVIANIQPEAMEELLNHIAQFRLGISHDNLPPGFYLQTLINENELVLCFSEHLKKDELSKIALTSNTNPFTLLYPKTIAIQEFKGDYRQFSILSSDPEVQMTLWRFLANDDLDDLPGVPGNREYCLEALRTWAKQCGARNEVVDAVFGNQNSEVIKNLKSLGQLFNHSAYQTVTGSKQGLEHWLYLSNQIYNEFGHENFQIWKKRILDTSQNWVTCLEKQEVNAIAKSMATLKDKENEKSVFWMLLDKHGEATGTMQYSHLWGAYEKLMDYMAKNNLVINPQVFSNYLSQTPNFHAQVFLDRLYTVLTKAESQLNRKEIQQDILNHIDQIDWRHNGFYLANQHQNYYYWDESLHLSEFHSTSKDPAFNYIATWEDKPDAESAKIHAMRMAATKFKLSHADFNQLKTAFNMFDPNKDSHLYRTLILSIGVGVDRILTMNEEQVRHGLESLRKVNPEFIDWFYKQFTLKTRSEKLQLNWEDLALVANALYPHFEDLKEMDKKEARELINACGRALQCYKKQDETTYQNKFQSLIGDVSLDDFRDNKIFMFCPWLVGVTLPVGKGEIKKLYEQLQSIDFSKSTYLPSLEDLKTAITRINSASNKEDERKQVVQDWIEKGCLITQVGIATRKLNKEERQQAIKTFENRLKIHFKKENLAAFEKLLDHLVVNTGEFWTPNQQLDSLMETFLKTDNKSHFNELGNVLNLLYTVASQDSATRYFSVKHLSSLMNALMNDNENQHYPINLLERALRFHLNDINSNLINLSLDKPLVAASSNSLDKLSKYTSTSSYCKQILVDLLLEADKDQLKESDSNYHINRRMITAYASFATKFLSELDGLRASPELLDTSAQFIRNQGKQLNETEKNQLIAKLTQKKPSDLNQSFDQLWQQSQAQCMTWRVEGKQSTQELLTLFPVQSELSQAYIQMIMTTVFSKQEAKFSDLVALKDKLMTWTPQELEKLTVYCGNQAFLTANHLQSLLNEGINQTDDLIHRFETVYQALNSDGTSKRNYSITPKDKQDLYRILKELKHNKIPLSDEQTHQLMNLLFYANSYSVSAQLEVMPIQDLQKTLQTALDELKGASGQAKDQPSARVLACLRELVLRKTGKWANHTQVLLLVYAAVHDENILHQMRTGQGKSIITNIRSMYLALNGNIVDVFSAKSSLSERDHADFAPVIDAVGLKHAYITDKSDASQYRTQLEQGKGAIHYTTTGNLNLFLSSHSWNGGGEPLDLDVNKRVAFIDEADHVALDEKTQANYSASERDSDTVYNFDEWVYKIVNDYYEKNTDNFRKNNFIISRSQHLEVLSKLIHEAVSTSPHRSKFYNTYILPTLADQQNVNALKKRDDKLMQLMTACHSAHLLQKNVDFCICPDTRVISDGMVINTRSAKVMIANQIQEGSTFSGLVQQFLHVKLNKEAYKAGEVADFFVDPVTQTVLSFNVESLMRTYQRKECATATPFTGAAEQAAMEKIFGINAVVKMPTHEAMQSKILTPQLCDDEQKHIEIIVNQILSEHDGPILIACEDDRAVQNIANKVKEALTKLGRFDASKWIVDTNDSGISESVVTARAKAKGMVTFSSRMGRGTDIKPEGSDGLMLLRTYASSTRNEKQERGRQGRNGARGTCQDILNYAQIEAEYNSLASLDRMQGILKERSQQLQAKLDKHRHDGPKPSEKWNWINQDNNKEKYLKTRALVQYKHELKVEQEKYLRQKEALLADLSSNIMQVLNQYTKHSDKNKHEALCSDWRDCIQYIEEAWNTRLNGKKGDSEEVYQQFLEKAKEYWTVVCDQHPLNQDIFEQVNKISETKSLDVEKKVEDQVDSKKILNAKGIERLLTFYQAWMGGVERYFNNTQLASEREKFFGESNKTLNYFFREIQSEFTQYQLDVIEKLLKLMEENQEWPHYISCATMGSIIKSSPDEKYDANAARIDRLDKFFEQAKQYSLPTDVMHSISNAYICYPLINDKLSDCLKAADTINKIPNKDVKEYLMMEFQASIKNFDQPFFKFMNLVAKSDHVFKKDVLSKMRNDYKTGNNPAVEARFELAIKIKGINDSSHFWVDSLNDLSKDAPKLISLFDKTEKHLGFLDKNALEFLMKNEGKEFDDHLKILINLKELHDKFPENNYFDQLKGDYCSGKSKFKYPENFVTFITTLNKSPDLKQNDISCLFNACFNHGTISDIHKLNDAVEVVKAVKIGNINIPDQAQRINLMKHAHHGLLDEYLKAKVQDSYGIYVQNSIPKTLPGLEERSPQLVAKHYEILISLSKEMKEIAQPLTRQVGPQQTLNERDQVQNNQARSNPYTKYKEQYKSQWFVNKTRKQQAKDLFAKLETINASSGGYKAVLKTITEAQNDIIEQDKKHEWNTKGYSRLYDITTKMFIEVAKNFLEDKTIPVNEKGYIYELLEKQHQLLVTTLGDGMRKQGQSLNIHKLPKSDELPKHLTYLLENLNNLSSLTPKPTQEPVNALNR